MIEVKEERGFIRVYFDNILHCAIERSRLICVHAYKSDDKYQFKIEWIMRDIQSSILSEYEKAENGIEIIKKVNELL